MTIKACKGSNTCCGEAEICGCMEIMKKVFRVTGVAPAIAGPAGEDPTKMISKTNLTADIAGKIKYGEAHAIDHQASTRLSGAL